jgi:hypothetical protein
VLPQRSRLVCFRYCWSSWTRLCFDPWEYAREPGEVVDRAKNLRRDLPFGDWGLVSVLIYEPDELVLVVEVNWAG